MLKLNRYFFIFLGARGVFIGRPVLYGLSYDGEHGVKEILNHMTDELKSLMRLTGE